MDLDLLDATAHGEDFGNSGDGLEASADDPIGLGAEILWRDFAGGIEHAHEHNVSHERSGGRHVGSDILGEFRCGEAFLNELTGLVDVGSPVEFDEGEREADVAGGAESVEAVDAHEAALEWKGDAGFDFFG